jgi:adenylosuccinate lyase
VAILEFDDPLAIPRATPCEGDSRALLRADKGVRAHLSRAELKANFDLDFHFAQVDTIFRRVFGRA